MMFTGKERDADTGLDYFWARYYSGVMGRFGSPDQPRLDQNVHNPQSWNLYAYVRNNTLRNRDPNGQFCIFGFVGTSCDQDEATRSVQGAASGVGSQLAHDGARRLQYQNAAAGLSGSNISEQRKALQARMRAKMGPIGTAVTNAALASRKDQLANKSAAELVESATKSSVYYNELGAVWRGAGAASAAFTFAVAAKNVAEAPPGEKLGAAAKEGATTVSAMGGALAGAEVGGGVGGPWGAFIGGALGGAGAALGVQKIIDDPPSLTPDEAHAIHVIN